MKNMEVRIVWACGLLVLFLKGCLNTSRKDELVTLRDNFMVWEGSCVMLPCDYTTTYKTDKIDTFIWYYNATYDSKQVSFNGTIVYNSKNGTKVDKLFAGHVQYDRKKDGDCTIIINDIKKAHEGLYNVRLLGASGSTFKWMSKHSSNIAVSDTGPPLQIHTPPTMTDSKSVTLTCSISYSCPSNNIRLHWTKEVNGTTTTYFRHDMADVRTTSTLTFQPSWRDHKKNITCVLERDNIDNQTTTVQLDVMYGPKIVQVLPNNATINITKPQSLNLTCIVESSNPPDYEITWYKDDKIQHGKGGNDNRFHVVSSGKYFCEAKNNFGKSTSNKVQVSVLYPPVKPVIKINEDVIKEGLDIKMECSTNANPPASRYVWFKDGEECFNHTNKWYPISNIKEGDSGSYTCLALNELGKGESDELKLNVLYAPRYPRIGLEMNRTIYAEVDKIKFVEGDKVTFHCNVNSSNPAIDKMTWYKNGKKIENVNKVLKAEDAGEYTCEATNSVGSTKSPAINVDVHYSPKGVDIDIKKTIFKENESISLTCRSTTSKPTISRYEWYKDDVLFRISTSAVLELQLEWTHTGWYSCKALNDIGPGASSKKQVNVQYAPKNVTLFLSTETHVSEYMDVKLMCMGKGNPSGLHYSFYLNMVPLSSGRDTYLLNDVQIKDTGDYSCLASNLVGDGISNVVSLHVSYSAATIGKFASIGASSFIILLILIFLIVRFRARIRDAFRKKAVDDNSDASFFVLKKSRESADNMRHQMSSRNSSTEQLNYSQVNFPVPSKRRNNVPSAAADNDVTTVYSVVKKVSNTPEYENIESSKVVQEDSQDEIHYSVIANLNKNAAERERDPEVEYAKLRHS